MHELIFWTGVNMDGTGDFVHAIEFFKAVKEQEELNKKYSLTLVIVVGQKLEKIELDATWKKHYARFKQQIDALNLPPDRCYFGTYQEVKARLDSANFQALFLSAKQHIVVSHPTELLLEMEIAPDATIKYIYEHESKAINFDDRWLHRSMGLGPKKYGLKIATIPELSKQDALSLLPQADPSFWDILATHTQSGSPKELLHKNLLLTAYFCDNVGLSRFLTLVVTNKSLPRDKDIVVYLSSPKDGKSLVKSIKNEEGLPDSSLMASIKQVEFIENNSTGILKDVVKLNTEGRVLRIFCNFRIDDAAFNALYRAAIIPGVSGDTSFERAIAFQTLPFYFSTNYSAKRETLEALQAIIHSEDLGIPEEIKRDFITYFQYENAWYKSAIKSPERIRELQQVNLMGMCAEWHKIALYLRKHFNIYNLLPQLVEEDIDHELVHNNEGRNPKAYASITPSETAPHQPSSIHGRRNASFFHPEETEQRAANWGAIRQWNIL